MSNGKAVNHANISKASSSKISPLALNGFTDCGVARLVDIRFAGCTTAPCTLTRGSQTTFEIDFAPRKKINFIL